MSFTNTYVLLNLPGCLPGQGYVVFYRLIPELGSDADYSDSGPSGTGWTDAAKQIQYNNIICCHTTHGLFTLSDL